MHEVVLTGGAAITARGDFHAQQVLARNTQVLAELEAGLGGGAIGEFALGKYLESSKTYLDRCSALALAGCATALKDAGQRWPADDADEFGIALGTHLGCLETMRSFYDSVAERGVEKANSILFSHSYLNSPISLCAIEFGLRGHHGTFCNGAASGLEAVRLSFDAIRLGHASAMLCGGVESLSPARQACEPGDNASEAACFFVLESGERAAQRGAQVLAAVSDEWFESADVAGTAQIFGDCGGATGALALMTSRTASGAST
jgi:3-oxoacyl-(acyl-carrier-protein) synthase